MAAISAGAWCERGIYKWRWFVEKAGTNNDVNALMSAPFFQDNLHGDLILRTGDEYYVCENGVCRNVLYFLVDEIYQNESLSGQRMHRPENEGESVYKKMARVNQKEY